MKLEPFCFTLPFSFAFGFNPVEKNGAGRGRENYFPFSQVENIERVEIFQDVCLLSVHHAFLFSLTAFLGAVLLLSTSMVYLHWPLVHCEKIYLVQRHCYPYLCFAIDSIDIII